MRRWINCHNKQPTVSVKPWHSKICISFMSQSNIICREALPHVDIQETASFIWWLHHPLLPPNLPLNPRPPAYRRGNRESMLKSPSILKHLDERCTTHSHTISNHILLIMVPPKCQASWEVWFGGILMNKRTY